MPKVLFFFLPLAFTLAAEAQTPVNFTQQQDQQNMMKQLGIQELRPGPSGNESAPNHANYDESKANPCPALPEILLTSKGKKVTSPKIWWNERRPEIVNLLESEMYGKIPENVPAIKWSVTVQEREWVNWIPVMVKQVIGHADNSNAPGIDVNIKMMLVVPLNVKGPVPVLMMFGTPAFPAPMQPSSDDLEKLNTSLKALMIERNPELQAIFDRYPAYSPLPSSGLSLFAPPKPDSLLSRTEQLLKAGWGYVTIDPASIQADNGAGLTRGIIGLTNHGQPRKPDQWGALRAWGWGASRALDYLETDTLVDAAKVGIEGVSRYGKAALVTMAFDQRFAMGLIGSSGKGGATLQRRVFGEAVESLTGGEYYWMAGNYMRYGAAKSDFRLLNGCDLPVDSHELIALCAPRLTFISYGIPEKGDARWLDQKGSFMATVAAGRVFRLLGARDLGVGDDYTKEEMPPVNHGLLDGQLAWRQHDGGHTDAPNMIYFIEWANRFLPYEKKMQ